MTEQLESSRVIHNSFIRSVAWGLAALLWLVPLVAMQFTDEVNWSVGDFVVFGAMLLGAGAAFEFTARTTANTLYRVGAAVAVGTAFLLVWVVGAVGIIGGSSNDANIMYFGVLGVGAIGALIGRLRPRGMAYAMVATALSQVLVAAIAISGGLAARAPLFPWGLVVLTGFFTALWLTSALMFRKAAQVQSEVGPDKG